MEAKGGRNVANDLYTFTSGGWYELPQDGQRFFHCTAEVLEVVLVQSREKDAHRVAEGDEIEVEETLEALLARRYQRDELDTRWIAESREKRSELVIRHGRSDLRVGGRCDLEAAEAGPDQLVRHPETSFGGEDGQTVLGHVLTELAQRDVAQYGDGLCGGVLSQHSREDVVGTVRAARR